ncbi:hypothetical protein Hanom_Chr07g00603881 [Helianthus anomalus]
MCSKCIFYTVNCQVQKSCIRYLPFSSLRFGQFCDFRPKVGFSTSRSKRF